MNPHCFDRKHLQLGLLLLTLVFFAGCATQPSAKSAAATSRFDLEGTWSWVQDPFEGEFTLTRQGDTYTGTLDDTFEGTFGDKITDVQVAGDHIRFTRYGQFGMQRWEGTLTEEDGVLKITDGQWTKGMGISGTFYAEKKE